MARPKPAPQTVELTIPGSSRKWLVPREVADAGQARAWIDQRLAEEEMAANAAAVARGITFERELETVAQKLQDLEVSQSKLATQQETIGTLQQAVAAQQDLIQALEQKLAAAPGHLSSADLDRLAQATTLANGSVERARQAADAAAAQLETTTSALAELQANAEGLEQRLTSTVAAATLEMEETTSSTLEAAIRQVSTRANTVAQAAADWLRGLALPTTWTQPDRDTVEVEMVNGETFKLKLPEGRRGAIGPQGRTVAAGTASGGGGEGA